MGKIEQAVILAGGRGMRLRPFTLDNSKAMYRFEGKPFMEYLLAQVRGFGIRRVLILTGYQAEKICRYFGDGSRFGLSITYSETGVDNETGYRLQHAAPLMDAHFLLLYCDNYCPIDFAKAQQRYWDSGAALQITAYANPDAYTRNNIRVNGQGRVTAYDKARKAADLQAVDIGYAIVDKRALRLLQGRNVNFEGAAYPPLADSGLLYAFLTEHRYYSVGSWERIRLAEAFFAPKKVAFLDRDGTLNEKPPKARYVLGPEGFHWISGSVGAVRLLKQAGYRVLLVTNQPGIARGELSPAALERIHEKMRRELREAGGDIDGIYICPHGWDDNCPCRKPKPGMLFQAQRDLSLDLTQCVLFGDDDRDIQAAESAGCHGIQVGETLPLWQAVGRFLNGEASPRHTKG